MNSAADSAAVAYLASPVISNREADKLRTEVEHSVTNQEQQTSYAINPLRLIRWGLTPK